MILLTLSTYLLVINSKYSKESNRAELIKDYLLCLQKSPMILLNNHPQSRLRFSMKTNLIGNSLKRFRSGDSRINQLILSLLIQIKKILKSPNPKLDWRKKSSRKSHVGIATNFTSLMQSLKVWSKEINHFALFSALRNI
jgi:mRNA-degrading endonuclease RelE of RelBE toxin-antitoxin system